MTRTEPVAAFGLAGIVTGIVLAVGDRYFPGVELPPEALVLIVGGIVGMARQWVVPHQQHVDLAESLREARAEIVRRSMLPKPKPGVRA